MPKFQNSQKIIVSYSSFLTLCAFIALTYIISSPSEPGNVILFGLSLPRLLLAVFYLCALILLISLTIKSIRDRPWADIFLEAWFGSGNFRRITAWFAGISFGLGWIGVFTPIYFFRKIASYWVRLQPLMLFIFIFGIATLVVLYIINRKFPLGNLIDSKVFRVGIILFSMVFIAIISMLISRFGVYSLEDFWYGAGVPILVLQLMIAIAGGVLHLQIEKKWKIKKYDLFLFILIFVITAFLWSREPLQKSFLFIGPYQPNRVLYPFADAANFDVGSQFALIGQKIFAYNSYFFERPLYLSFLVYLHTLFGQDYVTLMAVQAGIYAIFPALVYLIGISLNLRSVGFTVALVAMFRGVNSIAASNLTDMANPKMILTDFPAAIGVALVVLAACEWLKAPVKNQKHALWLGGALGFTLMLRTNALMLLAFLPPYAFFRYFPDWKKWVTGSLLILLAVVAVTLPWEIRNRSLGGQMYGPIFDKFKAVIERRYTRVDETIGLAPQLPVFKTIYPLAPLYTTDNPLQSEETCGSAACFVPNHFLHNIVTSILILPTSLRMDDLRHTVKEAYPYWNPAWNGSFTLPSLFFFFLNVFLIVLGISVLWRRSHWQGIAPLAIFMFYNLSNAFARTSGGRYIVPMDWIITFYFVLGVLQAIIWFTGTLGFEWSFESTQQNQERAPGISSRREWGTAGLVLIILLGIGSLVPLSETLHLPRYKDFDVIAILTKHETELESAGLSISSIDTFLQSANAETLVGRALYPRYYKMNQGDPIFIPTIKLPFPRMTFTLVGANGEHGIILPGGVPQHFPHASDVLVIGCAESNYIDALAVIILDETGLVYTRSPETKLQCPLQQPVCDNNSNCR